MGHGGIVYTRDATSDHHTYESSIRRDTVLRSLPTTVSVLGWRIIVHRWFCRDTVWEPACLGTSAVHHNVSICQALILLGRCGWLPPAEGNGNIELRGISERQSEYWESLPHREECWGFIMMNLTV